MACLDAEVRGEEAPIPRGSELYQARQMPTAPTPIQNTFRSV